MNTNDIVVPPYRTKGFHHPDRPRGYAEMLAMRGEQIFHDLLNDEGIQHLWWKITKAYTKQRFDFKVENWTIDVKSRPLRKEDFQMKEIDRVECDFYVGVAVSPLPDIPRWVKGEGVMGYLTQSEVAALPIDPSLPMCPGRTCPYARMHPVKELIETLKRD